MLRVEAGQPDGEHLNPSTEAAQAGAGGSLSPRTPPGLHSKFQDDQSYIKTQKGLYAEKQKQQNRL